MKNHIKCKVCGYIGVEKEIKNVCPACGAPISAFESYKYNISEKRQMILSLHIHPILVHFPQCLTFISLIFIVIAFLTTGLISSNLVIIEKLLSVLLPISVVIAAFAGLVDARTRFKKRFGPAIRQKILLGLLFLLSSVIIAVLISEGLFSVLGKTLIIILSIINFLYSGLLGKIGGSLLDAKLPDQQ